MKEGMKEGIRTPHTNVDAVVKLFPIRSGKNIMDTRDAMPQAQQQ
jgi:hypothetical protein